MLFEHLCWNYFRANVEPSLEQWGNHCQIWVGCTIWITKYSLSQSDPTKKTLSIMGNSCSFVKPHRVMHESWLSCGLRHHKCKLCTQFWTVCHRGHSLQQTIDVLHYYQSILFGQNKWFKWTTALRKANCCCLPVGDPTMRHSHLTEKNGLGLASIPFHHTSRTCVTAFLWLAHFLTEM